MVKITLREVVNLLHLGMNGSPNQVQDLVPTDVGHVSILCPSCSHRHSSKRATLDLNYQKNVFNCPRCHFSGNARDLAAYYTGWAKDTVEKRIQAGELGNIQEAKAFVECDEPDLENPEMLAPLARRNEVYTELHRMLELTERHRIDLMNRGLSEEEIEKRNYRSTPSFLDLTTIPRRLVTMGLELNGVPGFGLNKKGEWIIAKTISGFFVPGRHGTGLIQGEQIRADIPSDTTPKYSSFSSRNLIGGTGCSGWCHWAGADLRTVDKTHPMDVIIIEGWLKGDICHFLTGKNFLCVPGVSSLKKLFPALAYLRKEGMLRDLLIAYDMDAYNNPDVAKQLIGLFSRLKTDGYSVRILQWDKEFKGLDDWLMRNK